MGSTEEDTNQTFSHHKAASATEPLLSKPAPIGPSYPPIDEPARPDPGDSDHTQFLQISYAHGPRPFKDIVFLLLFLLLSLCTYAFGIFSIVHRNTNYSSLSSYTYDSSSTSCVKATAFVSDSNWVFGLGSSASLSSAFFRALIWTLVITFILSVPICFLLLLLLKHYAKQLVYVSIPFFVIMPFFFDIYWFVACTVSSSCSDSFPLAYRILVLVFTLLIIGVIAWILVANWHRIELTVMIIEVASDALSRNLGLFLVLPLLTLGLLVYYAPIVVFLIFARLNGEIVPRYSHKVDTCVWKQDSWVPAYYALAILTMLWSLATMVEAQVYVIGGTIAQWYFSKNDSPPRRSIRSSLRNAFGPSFGTVCFSGLLIFVVRVVRAAVDSARQEDTPGIVNLVLRCCVNACLSVIDFLNKFTINFVAITGEAYCTSARMTYELLKRNLLSAVFVETVSTRLLAGIIFVVSALYAIVLFAILRGASSLGVASYILAALGFLLLMVVLGFFVHVLDNVIDTVYVCYAIDRDRGEVYKQEVHEVYVQLPISRSQRSSIPNRTPGV